MAGINIERIMAKLAAIPQGYENRVARAGWFPGAAYEDGTSVAYVAAIQEYGAPEVGIPARPFVKPAIAAHKAEWSAAIADGVRASIQGSNSAESVLFAVGALVASDIQASIEEGSHQALSPVTVLLRKWRREGKTITGKTVGQAAAAVARDPSLIEGVNADPQRDTGLMIASVQHDVERE